MTRTRHDALTADLFCVPVMPSTRAGSMDHRRQVSHLVASMLKDASDDRYALAARTSQLVGRDISKAMLDGYTAEARTAFNLPLYLVPALETACGSTLLTSWAAEMRGGRLLVGQETLDAEIGRLQRVTDDANLRLRQLRKLRGVSR